MRFGGDKAAALLDGRPLLEHVADGLRGQVDGLIICGREWPGMDWIDDRPSADLGPLGGLNAALHYAQKNGFDVVVTAGCDVLPVPAFPSELLGGKAIYVDQNYLFGLWPAELASVLDKHLSDQNNLSMRHWIAEIGAHAIDAATTFYNLNTPSDVALYATRTSALGVR
jgi:molybdopterin-guanine dinucleotide biosynthesis protein A